MGGTATSEAFSGHLVQRRVLAFCLEFSCLRLANATQRQPNAGATDREG